MPFRHAYVIPIAQGIIYPVTFICTYTLAIVNSDVPPIFPYISDTGAWSLEKCIFTFMLGLGALLMFLTLYIRYRQVQEILVKDKVGAYSPTLTKFNRISIYAALVSALGLFLLASFQVWPFLLVHLTGASLAFICGFLVIFIQTYISFKIYPTLGCKCLNIFRAILTVTIGTSLICTGLFGVISYLLFKGKDITQWTENSGGYILHLVSVASEWVLCLGVILYLSLYTVEFRTIVLYKPKLEITS